MDRGGREAKKTFNAERPIRKTDYRLTDQAPCPLPASLFSPHFSFYAPWR